MKKVIYSLIAVISVLLVTGCGTVSHILKPDLNTNFAIISIYGNNGLAWYEMGKNGSEPSASQGLLSKVLTNSFDSDNAEYLTSVDRLDIAEDLLRHAFEENLGLTVADKEAVISSQRYKRLSEGIFSGLNTAQTATGYKVLEKAGAESLRKIYKDTETNCAVILKFEFCKKLKSGTKHNGEKCPYVTMRAIIYNETGKEVHYKTYKAEGESFKIRRNQDNEDEFLAAYPIVIESLINKLCVDLIK